MLQAVAAAVAVGAARGVAVAAGGAQPIPVVFHQLQVGSVHCRNIAAQDLFTQGLVDDKNAGAAGAGGKVLHPKLEQGDEKEVKIAVGTGDIHPCLAAAQGTNGHNLAGRFGAGADAHDAKEKHFFR